MTIYLAHGASGNAASMQPHLDGLRERGLQAQPISLSVGLAERSVPAYARQVDDLPAAIIGGQSYGGRVASLLAAEQSPLALVLLSYPLHRPGHPEWQPRTEHWSRISCPVLLLSGESDPFARIDLLHIAVEQLADHELVTYPRVGHGLRAVLDDALDRVATFAAQLSSTEVS